MTKPLIMKSVKLSFAASCLVFASGCMATAESASSGSSASASKSASYAPDNKPLFADSCISEREVVNAQRMWGDGIVRIGKVYTDKGNYSNEAADFIQQMYGYDLSGVLFKPTLAADDQFRSSFDAALSYFVGGNDAYAEDKGFAIKPYTNVKFDNVGIINNSCRMAVAMGNYFFTDKSGGETKVEYTFAYVKDRDNNLRIVAHQSSLPYNPEG